MFIMDKTSINWLFITHNYSYWIWCEGFGLRTKILICFLCSLLLQMSGSTRYLSARVPTGFAMFCIITLKTFYDIISNIVKTKKSIKNRKKRAGFVKKQIRLELYNSTTGKQYWNRPFDVFRCFEIGCVEVYFVILRATLFEYVFNWRNNTFHNVIII